MTHQPIDIAINNVEYTDTILCKFFFLVADFSVCSFELTLDWIKYVTNAVTPTMITHTIKTLPNPRFVNFEVNSNKRASSINGMVI